MAPVPCSLLSTHLPIYLFSLFSSLPPSLFLSLLPSLFHLTSSSTFGFSSLSSFHSSPPSIISLPVYHAFTHPFPHLSFRTALHQLSICAAGSAVYRSCIPSTKLLAHPPFSIHPYNHPLTHPSIFHGLNMQCPPPPLAFIFA